MTFKNFTLAQRVLAISLTSMVGFLIVIGLEYINREQSLAQSITQELITQKLGLVRDASEGFLNARRSEKDFFIRLNEKYVSKHAKDSSEIITTLDKLRILETKENASKVTIIIDDYNKYSAQFNALVNDWRLMGEDEQSGMRGKLRGAVRDVEQIVKKNATNDLMVKLLMMRRHEKDFIMRKTPKYIDSLNKRVIEFKGILKGKTNISLNTRKNILSGLNTYQSTFKQFTDLSLKIKSQTSILSKLYASADPKLQLLRNNTEQDYKETNEEIFSSNEIFFYMMIFLMVAIAMITVVFGLIISKGIIARAKNTEALTSEFSVSISELVNILSSATNELTATAKSMSSIAQTSKEQSESMANSSDETSANIQTVASSTEELTSSIRELSSQVQTTSASTQAAAIDVGVAGTQVKGLLDASERIGGVVEIISSIAEQTNLLALNATIESARAGEAGKGFAVVASEVKKLAQETTEATDNIGVQVTSVQDEIKNIATAIENINTKIKDVDIATNSIASAVEEQTAATDEISRNTQVSATNMELLNHSAGKVSIGSEETGNAANEVLSASEELNNQSVILQNKVTEFIEALKTA